MEARVAVVLMLGVCLGGLVVTLIALFTEETLRQIVATVERVTPVPAGWRPWPRRPKSSRAGLGPPRLVAGVRASV